MSLFYCQARVQVPNPLFQQAPNPDPKDMDQVDSENKDVG